MYFLNVLTLAMQDLAYFLFYILHGIRDTYLALVDPDHLTTFPFCLPVF